MKTATIGLILLFVSQTAAAALECSDLKCDVKWKTNLGDIDLSTVCYNYTGLPEYTECRSLAVEVFKDRCERGKSNGNGIWVDIYCNNALKNYKP